MAVSRAETLTSSNKKTEYFSDIPNNFTQTLFGNELTKVINERSITQSIKNLIYTNLGERMFQPTVGSDILAMLFQPNLEDYREEIELYIQTTIANYEPRAEIIQVLFPTDNIPDNINREAFPDSVINENSVELSIIYRVINNPEPLTLNLVLKRVR